MVRLYAVLRTKRNILIIYARKNGKFVVIFKANNVPKTLRALLYLFMGFNKNFFVKQSGAFPAVI